MDCAPNGASKAPSELFGSFPCQLPWPWPKLRKPLVLSTKAFAWQKQPVKQPVSSLLFSSDSTVWPPLLSLDVSCVCWCHAICATVLSILLWKTETLRSNFSAKGSAQGFCQAVKYGEVQERVCDITQRRAVITLCAKASDVQYMIWYVCLRPMPSWVQFSVKRTCVCPLSTAFWAHHFGSYWACGGARHSRSAIREDGMVADGICTCRNRCNKQRLRRNKLVVKGKRWQGRQEYALYTRAISTYIIIINHIQKIECFP